MARPACGDGVRLLVDDTPERVLRRLSIRDDSFIRGVLAAAEDPGTAEPLDAKTCAMTRIASLIALDAASPSYLTPVDEARAAGATDAEVVGCLVGLMPVVGVPRVVSAAPKLALALGYDVAAALEGSDSAVI
jgi:alkylhydroperoxidase/carboxymuconolactone decarboxylase family protein YurZ